MSDYVVGLTGGIGSGKTAVSDLFADLGIDVIDADVLARQVVELGSPALHLIAQKFGKDSLLSDGNLNRQYIREIVFSDPLLKTWLDNLLHPLIRQNMQRQLKQAKSPYCILAVPLLIENNMMAMVNRVLVVDVSEDIQLQRAANRDQQSQQQIKNIMANQVSRKVRLKHADDVIDNNGPVDNLTNQVSQLHKQYLLQANNQLALI
ncbi:MULTISPECIES: dephospho-CoA kinase [Alteromonadaceae]|uniref:dephospho-CoA kinase n=1 Tax=Alteromonadaceae TaxID=72275 RepID=UPI001C08E9FF|nr:MULTISPECIES: dephospho-CoA kinase [Aliiglaciecola]MBU2876927.1 dephospho-CoA kinase [Aliiglaciecola lipolytica]MDO6712617.1 dephospho-CoA kinase [Aliiglaciecola sp. 2_MG-2023]MDO6753775.1 dephospho-CoA kinase [Aliiglaciecola sp. 1_MG-2023]